MRSLPLSPLKEMRQQRRWGSEKTTTTTTNTNLQFPNARFDYSRKPFLSSPRYHNLEYLQKEIVASHQYASVFRGVRSFRRVRSLFGTETCPRNAQTPDGRDNNNNTASHNSNKIFLAKEKHRRWRQNGLLPERLSGSEQWSGEQSTGEEDGGRQAGRQAAPCAPNPNSRSSKNVEISNSSPLDETMEGARVNSLGMDRWVDRKTFFHWLNHCPS